MAITRPSQLDSTSGSIIEMRRARVFVRQTWNSEWLATPYLYCDRIVERLGQPTQFQFSYEAGEIKREDSATFNPFEPASIVGWFVKVELVPLTDDEDPVRWYGEIVSDTRRVFSGLDTAQRPIDQHILGRGLEHRLEISEVHGAYVAKASTSGVPIDTPLVWNRSPEFGATDQKNLLMMTPGDQTSICFDWTLTAPPRDVWHVDDAIAYLLSRYVKPIADGATFRMFNVAAGIGAFLASTPATPLQTEGQSVLALINFLLRPERGIGWRLVYDDEADAGTKGPQIELFSMVQTPVTVGDRTLPASTSQVDIDITGRHGVADLILGEDRSLRYGKIVVQGEPVLSCFTLSNADTTLDRGWTDAQKTAYDANATTAPDENEQNDRKRQQMVVYSRFVVKEDWDQKAGNGIGGSKTVVNPLILASGELHESLTANIRRSGWGMRFEPWIPVKEEDIGTTDKPYYKRAMAFVRDEAGGTPSKFVDALRHTRPDLPHGNVSPLDDALGFEVRFEPPHTLGLGQFTEARTLYPAVFDWRKMIVTGAVRLDQRCSVEQELPANPGGPTLYIDVPGAELWLVAPNTVIGLESDGQPKFYSGDRVVRDDRAKLKSELAMAVAYYGTPRRGMALMLTNIVPSGGIGTFVKKIIERVGRRTDEGIVNAAILERQFDFENGTTAIWAGPLRLTFGGQSA